MPEKFDFSKIEDRENFEKLPKEKQKEIIDKVQEEAKILQDKIEKGLAKNYQEAEKLIETEKKGLF